MPIISGSSGGGGAGGLTTLFKSTLGAPAASIDTGAGGFSTAFSVLLVFAVVRSATAAASDVLLVRFNNDSGATYTVQTIEGSNVTASSSWGTTTALQSVVSASTATASTPGMCSLIIPLYAATTLNKAGLFSAGTANIAAATGVDTRQSNFTWANTAAINRVAVTLTSGSNLTAGSGLLVCAA